MPGTTFSDAKHLCTYSRTGAGQSIFLGSGGGSGGFGGARPTKTGCPSVLRVATGVKAEAAAENQLKNELMRLLFIPDIIATAALQWSHDIERKPVKRRGCG